MTEFYKVYTELAPRQWHSKHVTEWIWLCSSRHTQVLCQLWLQLTKHHLCTLDDCLKPFLCTSCGLCFAIIMDIIQTELWELMLALHSYHMCISSTVLWLRVVTGSAVCGRLNVDSRLLYIHIYIYTGYNRRNGPDFGRVFLRSNYTDITQNTYIQSWTVTEILAREKSGLLWCLRTVLVSVTSFSPLLELHSYVRADVAPATLATGGAFRSV